MKRFRLRLTLTLYQSGHLVDPSDFDFLRVAQPRSMPLNSERLTVLHHLCHVESRCGKPQSKQNDVFPLSPNQQASSNLLDSNLDNQVETKDADALTAAAHRSESSAKKSRWWK